MHSDTIQIGRFLQHEDRQVSEQNLGDGQQITRTSEPPEKKTLHGPFQRGSASRLDRVQAP